jgi:hypothetical protein
MPADIQDVRRDPLLTRTATRDEGYAEGRG